jgi:murein DD-endopeptidase MepM/ murein hydrolase activator NlpD
MNGRAPALGDLVAAELAVAVPPPVTAMAAAIAARHPGALGVLFYGSCLREQQFEGLMLDFYLIVERYDRAFDRKWLATANRLLPPNVFPFEHEGLIAKYAVLSADDFVRLNGPDAETVSVWARFAQPSRLVWQANEAATNRIVVATALAAPTLFALAVPMLPPSNPDPFVLSEVEARASTDAARSPSFDFAQDERVMAGKAILEIWREGFALTYAAELRAERKGRNHSVVDADPARYEAFGRAVLAQRQPAPLSPADAAKRWKTLRRNGKALTLARLAKASATYAGGLDYLAWKISRHSGQKVEIKPWQRRWPILGALTLLPRLIANGAIR